MSVIYETTMVPTKRELISAWLTRQVWFAGDRVGPLTVIGGFRLDDPAGDVGMEMIIVVETDAANPMPYHVPLTYRGAELAGAEGFLLGTSEHGVLGTRWIYDAAGDPVWQEQMRGLLAGEAVAQHQNDSNVIEPTVTVHSGLSPAEIMGGSARSLGVIRRPLAGRSGSDAAVAWVNAQWSDLQGNMVAGAVVEFC